MNAPPVPTMREMVATCQRNADLAKGRADAIRNTLRALPPGPERDRCLNDLSRWDSDYHHWADYRGYYATRAAREGEGAVPSLGAFGKRLLVALPQRDTRLPREPGDDDEEPLPKQGGRP